jgi:hypothetical protein
MPIRIDYDFTEGTGYGGIQKLFPIDLPENYEFTFWLRAESPSNNFEIKFIDSTGNNVWWVNNRNYDFPREWTKIRIKKRHISFAWGPTEEHEMSRIDRIEFTVASFVGGKGTLWLDDLKFEPLPPETDVWPEPVMSASSSARRHRPQMAWLTDQVSPSGKAGREVGRASPLISRGGGSSGDCILNGWKEVMPKHLTFCSQDDGNKMGKGIFGQPQPWRLQLHTAS